MGVLGRYGNSALKYFNKIISSAYANQSTADMWIGIHAQAAEYGFPSPQTQPPDVSVIRVFANKIVNGARTLAAANDSDSITPDMMAIAPYTSSDYNTIATNPTYSVKYQVTWQTPDGTTNSRWNTSVFTATNMPGTVGDLRDTINFNSSELLAQAAQQVCGQSGGTLLNTSNLEITLVLGDGRARSLPVKQ